MWSQLFLIKPPHCYWLLPADSASGIRVSPFLLYPLISRSCWLFFTLYSLRGPLLSSQIITRRLILSYECPALAWLVSSQLFLTKIILSYLLPLGFYLSLFLYTFLYFFLRGLLCSWVAGPRCPHLLVLSLLFFLLPVFSFYPFSLPASPAYPFSCLAIGC